jgi:hypothetical protein
MVQVGEKAEQSTFKHETGAADFGKANIVNETMNVQNNVVSPLYQPLYRPPF